MYGTKTEILLIVFDVIVHDQNLLIIFCLQGVCRLLTVAPHKIITNLWLAYTVFDALMHYGIASKLAHVLFFDACVKSHAFLRMRSERSYWITCVAFIFFDACVNRMRLFAAKKSQRILSECTLTPETSKKSWSKIHCQIGSHFNLFRMFSEMWSNFLLWEN